MNALYPRLKRDCQSRQKYHIRNPSVKNCWLRPRVNGFRIVAFNLFLTCMTRCYGSHVSQARKVLILPSQDVNGAPSEKHSFYNKHCYKLLDSKYNIWQKQAYRFVIQQLIVLKRKMGYFVRWKNMEH